MERSDPESPWERPVNPLYDIRRIPEGPMKVETRSPVIGDQKLTDLLEELLADDVAMKDIQIVLIGAAPGSKIVAGPQGMSAQPDPVFMVCWAKETVRTPENG